jgi:hypothetical protein
MAKSTRSSSSDDNWIAALVQPIGDAIDQHRALAPREKNIARASGGASLITFCAYALIHAAPLVFDNLISFAIWAGLLGFGALWLCVGIKGSIGPGDIMEAFWSGFATLVLLGLMAFGAYLPRDWFTINLLLQGFYLAGLAGAAVRLWIATRGMNTGKLAQVKAQQAHGTARDATAAEAASKLNENTAQRSPRQFTN